MTSFTDLIDLAAEHLGGAVLFANDEFFAEKENLLKPRAAVFREHEYTDRGKWMDGWESRRRRTPGHDHCIVRLGLPGVIKGVVVDTAFFRGNYPDHCSIEATVARPDASPLDLQKPSTPWVEILPRSPLAGDAKNLFAVSSPYRYTHLRFNISRTAASPGCGSTAWWCPSCRGPTGAAWSWTSPRWRAARRCSPAAICSSGCAIT